MPIGGPVAIENEGARLAGTIYLPEYARPPLAAAVLVHGSGRTTRNDMRFMRDRLLAMGIAVLAYDKRGVGESTGEYDNVGVRTSPERMPLLGRDALAALRVLEARPGFDRARLGFAGVSQAGWIIPSAIADAREGEVRFAVIESGPAGSVGQEYAYSEATGDGFRPHEPLTPIELDARVDAYAGPSGFDNLPALRRIHTPILWLIGEADESIPVRHTLRNLEALARAGTPITVRTYAGANHSLFTRSGPAPFWGDVRDWLRVQGIVASSP
jgi:alpha-beta hydrolase superfamily lysophospholipase